MILSLILRFLGLKNNIPIKDCFGDKIALIHIRQCVVRCWWRHFVHLALHISKVSKVQFETGHPSVLRHFEGYAEMLYIHTTHFEKYRFLQIWPCKKKINISKICTEKIKEIQKITLNPTCSYTRRKYGVEHSLLPQDGQNPWNLCRMWKWNLFDNVAIQAIMITQEITMTLIR